MRKSYLALMCMASLAPTTACGGEHRFRDERMAIFAQNNPQ